MRTLPFHGAAYGFIATHGLAIPELLADARRVGDDVLLEIVGAPRTGQAAIRHFRYPALPADRLSDLADPCGSRAHIRLGNVVDPAGGTVVGHSQGDGGRPHLPRSP